MSVDSEVAAVLDEAGILADDFEVTVAEVLAARSRIAAARARTEEKVTAVVAALDWACLDVTAGRKSARKAINTTGVTASNAMLDAACKRRQSRCTEPSK